MIFAKSLAPEWTDISSVLAEQRVTPSNCPHKDFFVRGEGEDRRGLKPGCVEMCHHSSWI